MHEHTQRPWVTRREDLATRPVRAVRAVIIGSACVAAVVAITVTADVPANLVVVVTVGVLSLVAVLARHTVGALAAGAGLRIARPYCPGERVRLHVPSLGSVVDAEIVRVGPANTTLMASQRLVVVPNSHMLRANADHSQRPSETV